MGHIELHDHVTVEITSTDTDLLDDLEAELPADDADSVGPEYDGPNRVSDGPDLNTDEERLSARVTFVDTEDNGTTTTSADHATDLYDRLTGYDLVGGYEIRHYESPVGGVLASDVRAYYEELPESERPTDADGEPYVPSAWDPSNHTVSLTEGN
jgi:hypothetical protein